MAYMTIHAEAQNAATFWTKEEIQGALMDAISFASNPHMPHPQVHERHASMLVFALTMRLRLDSIKVLKAVR